MNELLEAAQIGNFERVTELLNRGDDPNAKDTDGDTALILAADKGHEAVVEALLKAGAAI